MDITHENAVLANLVFGIGNIKAQMETVEAMANRTALTVQETFAKTSLMPGMGNANDAALVTQLNATQAKRLNILRAGEAQAQVIAEQGRSAQNAILTQSYTDQAVKKMMADAQIKQSSELTNAQITQSTVESANRQVLAREKADAAIILSAETAAAKVAKINAEAGLVGANAGLIGTRANAVTDVAASQMAVQEARATQITAQGEASRLATVARGEARITTEIAREELTRQRIARESAATQLNIVRQQVEQERILYMQSRRAAFESSPTGMAGLMRRRMSWLGTGALVMGGAMGISETISTIKEVEMGMTVIARVTEDATFSFKGMRDELQQLGTDLGSVWQKTGDIATRWAQAGYNMSETIELTKDSLLALNTAELSSEQATGGLIAIMAQWGLTTDELLPTIDKINKVADDFAITSTDLVDGLQRSSGAAKVLGLGMNETIAILTTMREATGRTGKEVGNALNSILSFMQRPVAIKAFETEGIQVFADTARTEFRSVINIFDEMASKWPKMSEASRNAMADQAQAAGLYSKEMANVVGMEQQYSDIQQRDLSQAAAGIYRRNYLLALLQNWSKVDEVLISQESSLGYSMKENERTMQTLSKQVEVLKASAEQLAVALGDAGLLNELNSLVGGITNMIDWFNGLDDSMQTLLLTVAEVTVAVKLLGFVLGGMGIAGIGAGVGRFAEMARGVTSVAGAAALATTAVRGLGGVLVGALGGPWGIAAIAIGTAIGFIAREANKASEELATQATMAEGLVGEYDNLTTKLDGMTKGTDEYNQSAKELSVLKGNIAETLPSVIDGYDRETDSIIINRAAMDDMIQAGEELKKSKEENKDAIEAEITKLQEERKEHEANAQEYESSQGVLADLEKRREELTAVLAKQSKGSEEAKTTQEALGETERLIANIAQEAGLTRTATIDDIMKKLNLLSVSEREASIATQIAEAEKTQSVVNNATKRMAALAEEINATKSLLAGDSISQYTPPWLKGKYNVLPGGELWIRKYLSKDLSKNQEDLNAENTKRNKKRAEMDAQLAAINKSQNELNKITADDITSGGGGKIPSTGGGSTSGSKEKVDTIKQYLEELGNSAKQFEIANYGIDSAMKKVNDNLAIAGAEYDNLNKKVQSGTATAQDYARMQELVAVKSSLLKSEQLQLASANQQYQREINALNPILAKATASYEQFKKAGDFEHMKDAQSAVSSLHSEIDNLSDSIASNTAKVWENKSSIEELSKATYTAYYQQTMSWMNHMEAMGNMNTQQQLDTLKGLDAKRMLQADIWKVEEQKFKARRDLLKEEMSNIKTAYDNRMQMYQDEVDANEKSIQVKETAIDSFKAGIDSQITAIEKLRDALDDQAKQDDKAKALEDHNKKLAELNDKRLYHELRTGLEHVDAIADIDKQMAEENRNWQLTQNDWSRDAQKDAYNDQIDALKDQSKKREDTAKKEIDTLKKTNDTKKQELQSYYKQIESMLNDNSLNMVASIGSFNEQFYQKALENMRAVKRGVQDGEKEIGSEMQDFFGSQTLSESKRSPSGSSSGAPVTPAKRPIAVVTSGQYVNENSRTYMWSQELAGLLGKTATWDQSSGKVSIGGKSFTPYRNVNGRTLLGIGEVSNALGYSTTYDETSRNVSIWDKAHDGAKVMRGGIAELRHDERVLSPNLTTSFDRLASVLVRTPDMSRITGGDYGGLERKLDRLIAVTERRMMTVDKAVNIEHVSFDDRADMQAFGVEVRSILATR